jgi:hypothetical protein
LKSLFSIALLFLVFGAFAQPKDTALVAVDTVKNRFVPTGIRIGTDAIALVKSNIQDNFKGWEVNAEVDFNRYYLNVEYGSWGRNFLTDSATYQNDGRYWRVGVDVNFLLKDPDRNMFFIGLRYGRSNFSEQMTVISDDDIWGANADSYNNSAVTAQWKELTSGIRVKIYKFIWMGYTARFKFGLNSEGQNEMLSHDVPGYGRTDKETTWGFNYQIFVRIPFRNP